MIVVAVECWAINQVFEPQTDVHAAHDLFYADMPVVVAIADAWRHVRACGHRQSESHKNPVDEPRHAIGRCPTT